ncbi:hypothetical protein GGI20_006415, partial [Coemansia sp. BCRC 34301]
PMGKKRSSTTATQSVGQVAASATDSFAQAIPDSFMQQYISRPGAFVVPSEAARAAAMDVVGSTYNAANFSGKFGLYDDWNTVLESGFDPSLQIWELINVRNVPVLKYTTDIMKELSQLIDSVNDDDEPDSSVSDPEEQEEIGDDSADSEEDSVGAEVSEDESDVIEQSDLEAESASDFDSSNAKDIGGSDDDDEEDEEEGSTRKSSVLDDQFFSLAEVEKFADDADEEDMRDRAILSGDYPKPPAGQTDEESASSDEDEDDDID